MNQYNKKQQDAAWKIFAIYMMVIIIVYWLGQ